MTTASTAAASDAVVPPPFNRQQRRMMKAAIIGQGLTIKRNGIAQATLTPMAYDRLVSLLEGHGNNLSTDHRAALMALVGLMTKMAQGALRGRWAFGLPTGLGKTSAIIAWCAALHSIGADHISVAASASKVEALCQLKRDLISQGVPADRIGLVHSYTYDPAKITQGQPVPAGYASEPSEGTDRQIMLVTHARVRGCALSTFNTYQGRKRDLLIYDESLMVSDSLGIPFHDLKGAVGYLAGQYGDSAKYAPLVAYLIECRDRIGEELERQKNSSDDQGLIRLPATDHMEGLKALLPRHSVLAVARSLLEIAQEDVRVVTTGQGGVIHYEVSVPSELTNVLVLDASYPIRKLSKLDSTMKDAEKHLPEIKRIGVSLSALKSFDQVTVHQMFAGGGRDTMQRDFAKPDDQRTVTREVIEVVRQVSDHETVLIFTYLARPMENKTDYRVTLLRDLAKAGIDTEARVNGKRRINVVTWGMETNLNDYAHCSHVVLAGVLQRSPVDLAASYLGQLNNLTATVSPETIKELRISETVHMIYQALSRGSCRVIDNGHARPMTAWIIHRDPSIRAELEKVMPGARWETWTPKHSVKPTEGTIARTASAIVGYLSGLEGTVVSVSTRKVKEALSLGDVPLKTFTRAVHKVTEMDPSWLLRGRSLVRGADYYGFPSLQN